MNTRAAVITAYLVGFVVGVGGPWGVLTAGQKALESERTKWLVAVRANCIPEIVNSQTHLRMDRQGQLRCVRYYPGAAPKVWDEATAPAKLRRYLQVTDEAP